MTHGYEEINNGGESILNHQKENFDNMNIPITENEVEMGIRNLKSKKSPGFDRITNEMIKCTNPQEKNANFAFQQNIKIWHIPSLLELRINKIDKERK